MAVDGNGGSAPNYYPNTSTGSITVSPGATDTSPFHAEVQCTYTHTLSLYHFVSFSLSLFSFSLLSLYHFVSFSLLSLYHFVSFSLLSLYHFVSPLSLSISLSITLFLSPFFLSLSLSITLFLSPSFLSLSPYHFISFSLSL